MNGYDKALFIVRVRVLYLPSLFPSPFLLFLVFLSSDSSSSGLTRRILEDVWSDDLSEDEQYHDQRDGHVEKSGHTDEHFFATFFAAFRVADLLVARSMVFRDAK